ncbi:hypothetical protein [Lentibacillus daqui]|nr:hypothetical protein [Lentibacillus daqui]
MYKTGSYSIGYFKQGSIEVKEGEQAMSNWLNFSGYFTLLLQVRVQKGE